MWYILNFKDHIFYSASNNDEAERIILEQAKLVGADMLEIVNGFSDDSRLSADEWMQEYAGHTLEDLPNEGIPDTKFQSSGPRRLFYIDTPVGKLKVWAKNDFAQYSEQDDPEDFPGVYIDLMREGHPDTMVACVEWESCIKQLQTCLYADFNEDTPSHVVKYDISKLEEIESIESET